MRDDDVVEHLYSEEARSLDEVLCDCLILWARAAIARWVKVDEDDAAGVGEEHGLEYFSWIDGGC